MEKESLKELRRLILTLPKEEAETIINLFDSGQRTGYATVDRPWDFYYEKINKNNLFLNTTPYQGLIENNKDYPNEIALEYFGSKVTFDSLFKNIDIVAKSLEEYGVKKGDFVTVCSTTSPEVVYIFYAISKIGAIVNSISPFYTQEQLFSRIEECDSKVIIMVDKFLPKFKDGLNKLKEKNIIVLPMMNSSILRLVTKKYRVSGKNNEVAWKTFINDGKHRSQTVMDPYEVDKPQAMVYSSGTTGASKGILLSVDSFQKVVNAYGNSGFDISRNQKVYQNIPSWATTGMSLGINFPLSFGVRVCIDPRFEHDVFIKNILKFKPEYVLSVTSMYQGFTLPKYINMLKGKSLEFLKYPVEGGEPLTIKDIKNIEDVFKTHGSSARLLNGYGQCECGATVTTDITDHKFSNIASGIPLPDITTVGIFDDNFNELKYGERGNIMVKTQIGMLGYYKNEKATNDFFFFDSNNEKWCVTGDIGYIQEDGSLVVLGRKSDFSIIDGKKIYNFDIENAILSSGLVKLCEVQTLPDNDNKLVAHIVWENEVKEELDKDQSLQISYLIKIQESILNIMNLEEAVPTNFCVKEKFPSAISGKRDINFIKNDVDDLITISDNKKTKLKK